MTAPHASRPLAAPDMDTAVDVLRSRGLRVSAARRLVLEALFSADRPVPDASFDAALSVQVLEYVAEVDAALAELRRALRPGGRLVIWDIDWSTVSWHSADPVRMRRVLRPLRFISVVDGYRNFLAFCSEILRWAGLKAGPQTT